MASMSPANDMSPTEWEHVDSSAAVLDQYFAPVTARQGAVPTPPASTLSSPGIIQRLLDTAGVGSSRYPPTTWDELTQILSDIEQSNFDRLKRNGLILYLLLDYHLLPVLGKQTADDVPQIAAFIADNYIPRFWQDGIYRGYWQLDKGLYAEAQPWLDADNSLPYAHHIILALASGSSASGYSRQSAQLVVDYYRATKPELSADADPSLAVIKTLLVAKASVEGVRGALDLVSTQARSAGSALLLHLWTWLFQKSNPAQVSLIKSLTWLPLTLRQMRSLTSFALGEGIDAISRGEACSLALDTLLVRLINSGQVAEALRVNAIAEQRPGVYASSDSSDSQNLLKVKKRSEMLRLARDMLPETVKAQLDEMRIGNGDDARPHSPRAGQQDDESMGDATAADAAQGNSKSVDQPMADPATPVTVAADHSAVLPGFLKNRNPAFASSASSAARASSPGYRASPAPKESTASAAMAATATVPPTNPGTPSRVVTKPLPSQSPFASSSKAAAEDAGPYSRLASMIKERQKQKSGSNAANQQQVQQQQVDFSLDESMLISSLLPKKRALSAAQRKDSNQRQRGQMDVDVEAINEAEMSTQQQQEAPETKKSNFEAPKRRYTKNDAAKTTTKSTSPAKSRRTANAGGAESSGSTRAAARASRIKASKSTPSMAVSQPRSVATFPDDDDDGDVEASGQGGTIEGAAGTSLAGQHTRRSARAGSESVPGAFPGQGEADGEDEDGAHDGEEMDMGVPEMVEVPRRRGGGVTQAGSSAKGGKTTRASASGRRGSASAAATAATDTYPTSSTPIRRSTRGHSRASSVASSINEDGEDEDGDEGVRASRKATTTRSRRSKQQSQSSLAASPPQAKTTTRARITRSQSVASLPDAEEEEEGEGSASGEGEEGDETPRAPIKTRSGRTIKKRVL